jgi:6-phosphogluconolactonase (cycloisomerase 2 family)
MNEKSSRPTAEAPRRSRLFAVVATATALAALATALTGLTAEASAAAPLIEPVKQEIILAGSPFAVLPTPDGKYVFASLSGASAGTAIIERNGASDSLVGTIPDPTAGGGIFGLAITHDGKYLLATVQDKTPSGSLPTAAGVQVIDVHKAVTGAPEPVIGYVPLPEGSGPVYAEVSNDDRYLFVSDEDQKQVAVIDLAAATTGAPGTNDLVGFIPVGALPVGIVESPDGRYVYITSEEGNSTDPGYNPTACSVPGSKGTATPGPEGTVTVVDTQTATTDPADSVVSTVTAGCQPVRIALGDGGKVAWVTDRTDGKIAAYDTEKLVTDPTDALISRTTVGVAPVGLQLFDDGQLIAVANSNRFGTINQQGTISIVNARKALRGEGESATLATFSAGEFPREMGLSPDGQSLYLAEYNSNTFVDFSVPDLVSTLHPVAEFELALTTGGDGSGSFGCKVDGGPEGPCQVEYPVGSSVEVVPHAAAASEFAAWAGDCSGFGACVVTTAADRHVVAVFKKTPVQGSTGAGGSGDKAGAPSPGRPAKVRAGRAKVHGSTATLAVTVSGPGTVTASGKGLVAAKVKARHAGTVELKLELTDASKRALSKKGAEKIRIKVVFTSSDGQRRTTAATASFARSSGK